MYPESIEKIRPAAKGGRAADRIQPPPAGPRRWPAWSTLAAALATAGLTAWTPLAHAGLFDDEEARKAIQDLRRTIDQNQADTQRQLAARQAEYTEQLNVLKRSLLDLNNQIEVLRSEVAKLRGQDEQVAQSSRDIAKELAELQRKQKDALTAIEDRMRRLEPQKVNLDGKEISVDPAEKKAYDEAITTLRKGEFARAAEVLQGFQQRFPTSPYSGHVQYWLGNALYGKGDAKSAAVTFRNLVTSSPEHPRAAEALLALANCQVELKDGKAARKTLEELVKGYPNSDAAVAGKERLSQIK
jgi:tol-pal system protein YbgF